jgi:uncharacterized protein (DUF58 family)
MVTGRGVLVFALGLPALAFWPDPALALLVLISGYLAVLTLDRLLAANPARVSLRREGARQTRVGEVVTVQLTVTNTGRRKLRGVVRDAWVPSAGAQPFDHRLVIRAGGSAALRTVLHPTRRGERHAELVTIRSTGPLGLASRQSSRRTGRRITPPWSVRALPPFTSRRFLPEKLSRLRQLDGAVAVRGRGQGTEFDSLREYTDGDDVRSIDWRATARRSAVVVRTWRPERDRRVVCYLDTGRTSAARVGDIPRLDATLDACLLLAAVASRADDRIDLLAADAVVRATVEGVRRSTVLPRMVEAMTELEPALVESDYGLMVSEILRRERKRCLVVLFTALEPSAIAEGLLPVLGRLTSRHTVILAAVGDPSVSAMSELRGDTDAVYSAAAAERALGERRRITGALHRRGVEVVDAPADNFASKVVDAYLDLKAAGRL